jgi:peptidoglycan hydrolase-like protein with peptidoglycan-binding domain
MAQFEHNSLKFGYINLDDLEGVQNALTKLGYDPGTADGKDGPKTQGAVKTYQTDAGLKVDGIAGPMTKESMVATLQGLVDAGETTA